MMVVKKNESERAVIILHEIYGINQYIMELADFFYEQGYDTYCLDLNHRENCFSYSEQEEAYAYFKTKIGFEVAKEVESFIKKLGSEYNHVIVFGSSVGATIAWRLSENRYCSGMIGFYGSRIRDYLEVDPDCPCLLLFAEDEEAFCVDDIVFQLRKKKDVRAAVLKGKHGFGDRYAENYHIDSSKLAFDMVECFLKEIEE
ncbi:dienelactone hydrolase family protein [Acetobacterium paludosum]|nr:dienelactone hydrolase family protein [Acetobacterium paludosum]